jgi:hypothetical protein
LSHKTSKEITDRIVSIAKKSVEEHQSFLEFVKALKNQLNQSLKVFSIAILSIIILVTIAKH